jgi:membrane-associated phospholipid phosphatase
LSRSAPVARAAIVAAPARQPVDPRSFGHRLTARLALVARVAASPVEGGRALLHGYTAARERHRRVLFGAQLLYLALFIGWLLLSHTWPAPDVVVVSFLGFAILTAQGLRFLRDWTPFLVLLLAYVGLTGVAPGVVGRAHIGFPITVDRWVGAGQLPTTRLQAALWDGGRMHWYDYLTAVMYLLHFVVPLAFAFLLWHWRRVLYWRFVYAYVLLMAAAFATYLVFPMAPPWWASDLGRIPQVDRVLGAVQWQGISNPVVLLSRYFQTDPVAAMPSMHAAFPVLVWLVLWRLWPRWGWAAICYPLLMAFAVIYAGEHYLIDVLAGWLYAALSFLLVWRPWRPIAPASSAAQPEALLVLGRRPRIRVLQPVPTLERRRLCRTEIGGGDGD